MKITIISKPLSETNLILVKGLKVYYSNELYEIGEILSETVILKQSLAKGMELTEIAYINKLKVIVAKSMSYDKAIYFLSNTDLEWIIETDIIDNEEITIDGIIENGALKISNERAEKFKEKYKNRNISYSQKELHELVDNFIDKDKNIIAPKSLLTKLLEKINYTHKTF